MKSNKTGKGTTAMDQQFYIENRRALSALLEEDTCIAAVSTGYPVCRSADENYPFQPNTNALYLLGISQAFVHYVLIKDGGRAEEFLFIDEYDAFYEKWIGHRLTADEAAALCGIPADHILHTAQFEDFLAEKAAHYRTVYLDLESQEQFGYATFGLYLSGLLDRVKDVDKKDLYPLLCRLRSVKKPCEIEAIRRAIAVTRLGVLSLMDHAAPGMYEYQLEAWFDHVIKDNGNRKFSFPTIAASGINATTIHYMQNNSLIRDGDLLLFDLGCRDEEYCADISRTFPANGKFTDLQKTIYEIVLHANKTIAAEAKAGMTLRQLQIRCTELLADGCLAAGLIQKKEEISRYYVHGVSHPIGLDCHDPALRSEPLPVGAVISDEPGLYFPEYAIGVRIEDDLLLEEDGAVNLSADIPKEIDEIEAYMKNR